MNASKKYPLNVDINYDYYFNATCFRREKKDTVGFQSLRASLH